MSIPNLKWIILSAGVSVAKRNQQMEQYTARNLAASRNYTVFAMLVQARLHLKCTSQYQESQFKSVDLMQSKTMALQIRAV